MTEQPNSTADDTRSDAAGPPEAGGIPAAGTGQAPDVEVTTVSAGDAGQQERGGADDVSEDAAAPEPPD